MQVRIRPHGFWPGSLGLKNGQGAPEQTVRRATGHRLGYLGRTGSMNYLFLLIPPLALAAFVGFWCLIVKGLAVAGWQRLATQYRVAGLPAGPRVRLSQASVGGVRYRGAITAGALPEGLALATGFPFGVGHPPLLIPWSACGPFRAEQSLWMTFYTTEIRTSGDNTLTFTFASEKLLEAARPWISLA